MLTNEQRGRVAVVLVRARNPHNIGAVARAMHDFGFADLRIVNPYTVPLEAAQSAVDASDVVAQAGTFPTLAEAVADCTLVLGTTAVGARDILHPLDRLCGAVPRIAAELSGPVQLPLQSPSVHAADAPRVAILFGSEKTGLSNQEFSHCHRLLTIPMHPHPDVRHPSMNLGQAVAVCLYELVRDRVIAPRGPAEQAASMAEVERLQELLTEVLTHSDYLRHHPANSSELHLRRLAVRFAASRADAPVWMGMLRQILWKLRQAPPPADR